MNKQEYVAWLRFVLLTGWVVLVGWILFAEAPFWTAGDIGWKSLKRVSMLCFGALLIGSEWIRRRSAGPVEDERDGQIAARAHFNALVALSLMLVVLATMADVGNWAERARAMPDAWLGTSLIWLVGVAWALESAIRVVYYVRDRL